MNDPKTEKVTSTVDIGALIARRKMSASTSKERRDEKNCFMSFCEQCYVRCKTGLKRCIFAISKCRTFVLCVTLASIYLTTLLSNLFIVFIGGQYCVRTHFGQKFLVWWNQYHRLYYVGGFGAAGGAGDRQTSGGGGFGGAADRQSSGDQING